MLALALLVYAFILSPIIRELLGGSMRGQPREADQHDDGTPEATDAPQTLADSDAGSGSQTPTSARIATRVDAGAATSETAIATTPTTTTTATTTRGATTSSSDA